jgi:hypothetical protein
MIDLSSIYHNPIVPEGYYYVQVVHLETDDVSGCKKPRILVELEPWWEHDLDSDTRFSAIVYPTESARFYYENFQNTFLKNPNEPVEQALHRWGCVQILNTRYNQTEYSSVKWIRQIQAAKKTIAHILKQEPKKFVRTTIPSISWHSILTEKK